MWRAWNKTQFRLEDFYDSSDEESDSPQLSDASPAPEPSADAPEPWGVVDEVLPPSDDDDTLYWDLPGVPKAQAPLPAEEPEGNPKRARREVIDLTADDE